MTLLNLIFKIIIYFTIKAIIYIKDFYRFTTVGNAVDQYEL